jgi:hypothetical protein
MRYIKLAAIVLAIGVGLFCTLFAGFAAADLLVGDCAHVGALCDRDARYLLGFGLVALLLWISAYLLLRSRSRDQRRARSDSN